MEGNKNIANNTEGMGKDVLTDIREIIESGIRQAYHGVHFITVQTYWKVGRRIVEEEQQGEERAEYGTQLINRLAKELQRNYQKGYSPRDLRSYRQFYLCFKDLEKWHSRVPNLTRTHFRTLLRVTSDDARYWYVSEASKEMWSVRTLDRNVGSQYYFRLLQSQKEFFKLSQI